MPQLTLYYMDSCPYCHKVLGFLKQAGISVPMKNTSLDSANKEELRHIGGKTQVPCLVIDGTAMYESDDIITWFKTNYRK